MKKRVEDIDINFAKKNEEFPNVVFRSVFEKPFGIYGLYKPYELKDFMRLPPEFARDERVNEGVRLFLRHTAGGRVRFATDSEYIIVRAVIENPDNHPHMAATGTYGMDMYERPFGTSIKPRYTAIFIPHLETDGKSFSGSYCFKNKSMREVTINFPLYSGLKELYIGLEENAEIQEPTQYAIQSPVVFYGSSITQGGCASRPGAAYSSVLSRMLDVDIINLGFTGSACGEPALAEYIANIPMSAFVLDYDFNARTLEQLGETHYSFYETVRKKNPGLPIIMMTAPVAAPAKDVPSGKAFKKIQSHYYGILSQSIT